MDLTEIQIEGYERVVRAVDKAAGLTAFIAVHDTTLGPALGGLRMWSYADQDSALTDVLRLAEGMTYKNALAETGHGGGKAVVLGDPRLDKTEALFLAMGEAVQALGGRYITAEDVGTCTEDMRLIRRRTRWVTGLPVEDGSSGDPSPFTATGVYLGILATARRVLERDEIFAQRHEGWLAGVRVAVQGLGNVGRLVAEHLIRAGAELVVSDLDAAKVGSFVEAQGHAGHPHPGRYAGHPHPGQVHVVGHEEIYGVRADIFAPCALGGVLSERTIPQLRVRAVAGAANNQLLSDADGQRLMERGILYAPDFVINAGGVINIAQELRPEGYDRDKALRRVEAIPRALADVWDLAAERGWPTHRAAVAAARGRLENARAGQMPSAAAP